MADETAKVTAAQRALGKVIEKAMQRAHNAASKSLKEIEDIGDNPGTDATALAALRAFVEATQPVD